MKMRVMAVMVVIVLSAAGFAHGELKDNGDGTITDTTQRLVWLKNANCYGDVSWYDSLNNRAPSLASGQCGLTDKSTAGQWRMPTRTELQTRAANTSVFINVRGGYWTSETSEYGIGSAWVVSLYGGNVYSTGKGNSRDMSLLPVRAITK